MELLKNNSVGISNFVKRQIKGSGKTYTSLTFEQLAEYAESQIKKQNYTKGYREGVILVNVDKKLINLFTSSIVKIENTTKLEAIVKKRSKSEHNYISIKALNGKPLKISKVELVLYRHDVLEEGNERSTDKYWELIAFFGTPEGINSLPIGPVTMMRNQLTLPGGTKAEYSASEWAESVNFWQKYALLK